ncbi:MAG: ATP F0F1 synthase subunit B [Pseudomonadota bacterium]
MDILYNTSFMAAVSLFLFFGILACFGVHKMIGKLLDDRAAKIRADLDEAKQLREDAQEIFAEFERKQKSVTTQAEEIVAHAKAEAEAAAERAKEEIAQSVERRLRAADEQIAMAEATAVKEVRDQAVTIAIAAAAEVLSQKVTDERAAQLVDSAIAEVGGKLH